MSKEYDYLIIGAGIIGMSMARILKQKYPDRTICIIEKENKEGAHASTRNSGVLHAGFYYTADSLKAKFTVEGNQAHKDYCHKHNLKINECGKLVVAQNEDELNTLYELEKRGKANGSDIRIIDEAHAREIEPNVKTFKKALHSPNTASVDPKEICEHIKKALVNDGVLFSFDTKYLKQKNNTVITSQGDITAKKIINCAGLYADHVAQDFGFGKKYTMIPFKGIYLKYTKNKTDIKTNIYPVPNLKNPFLGVHFTITVDGTIKIGPTAIPALWRENYQALANFSLSELLETMYQETKLFTLNSFNFRHLAFEEIQKYNRSYFVKLAQNMVQSIDPAGFTEFTKPGIRAQLLDKTTNKLLQDFVVEGDQGSVHVLNAVSPGWTCAYPFTEYVVNTYNL